MTERAVRLPDVGEGVAEAELVEWLVKVGDHVQEEQPLAVVMTDKASIEVPTPIAGEVVWLAGEPGQNLATGSDLVRLRVDEEGDDAGGLAVTDVDRVPEPASVSNSRPASGPTSDPDPGHVAGHQSAAASSPTAVRPAISAVSHDAPAGPEAAGRASGGRVAAAAAASTTPGDSPGLPGLSSDHASGPADRPLPVRHGEAPSAGAPGPRLRPGATPILPRPVGERPLASPSVRLRAREAGVDLRRIAGSGPAGRITHDDLDRLFEQGPQPAPAGTGLVADESVEDIPVIGLRRRIVEKMRIAHERVVDLTYVEEVDVTELETLRARLNKHYHDSGRTHLTPLPFLMRAMAIAIAAQPRLNAHFDDDAGVLRRHGGVHIGIAAQTAAGLVVPVVRHVEARDLWSCAAELARVTDAAKGGTATREELSGSTITLTSLGPLGGLMSTPIINYPEVAIVGVNRIAVRPHWDGHAFVPRRMMNLSCSFDHRIVDGWDGAVFVQRIKALIETPAMLFVS